jgi:hypothetical protein
MLRIRVRAHSHPAQLSLLKDMYESQNAALVEEAQRARAAAEAVAWELDVVRGAATEAKAQVNSTAAF